MVSETKKSRMRRVNVKRPFEQPWQHWARTERHGLTLTSIHFRVTTGGGSLLRSNRDWQCHEYHIHQHEHHRHCHYHRRRPHPKYSVGAHVCIVGVFSILVRCCM